MNEIIQVNNQGYAEYEALLLERDHVKKQAIYWKIEYTKTFGKPVSVLKAFRFRLFSKRLPRIGTVML